jgi:hypothetical protein
MRFGTVSVATVRQAWEPKARHESARGTHCSGDAGAPDKNIQVEKIGEKSVVSKNNLRPP